MMRLKSSTLLRPRYVRSILVLQVGKVVGAATEFLELGAGARRMDGKGPVTPLTRQHLTPNLLHEWITDILV